MVEKEYVEDLYNIGLIVCIGPFIGGVLTLLAVVIGAIFGGSLNFGFTDGGTFALGCQMLTGFLIMVYVAWKYHHKKVVKGEV